MSLILLLDRPLVAPPPVAPPAIVYSLTVNGTPKKLQPGWTINEAANWRNTFNCEVLSQDGTYRPPIGAEVVVTEDGVRIFGGLIETPSESGIGDRGFTGITTRVAASDYNVYAERRQIDLDISSTTVKVLLQTVMPYLTPYGVTLDPGQVTGPILPALSYRARKLSDIFDEIARLANGYIWEIDYNKVLRMFVPGSASAPFGIFEADRNVEGDISVEPSRTDYANRIVLLFGTGQKVVTEPFTGNGTTITFTLGYALVAHTGLVSVNGVNETLGTGSGISSGGTWTYDPAHNWISRISPPAIGAQIRMTYNAQFPARAVANPSVPAAPADLVERVITAPDVFDNAVAQALAESYLTRAMLTPRTVRYTTPRRDIHPGQTQPISVTKRNLSGAFLITDVQIRSVTANLVRRSVTAVEGTQLPETWRDSLQQMTSGTSSGATSGSAVVAVVTSGGVGGAGTVGRIAKWATGAVLGNSIITDNGAQVSIAGLLTALGISGPGDGLTNLHADQLTGTLPAALLAGRSLGELGTRSADDITSGALAYARLPSGAGVWLGAPTINGLLTLLAGLLVTGTLSADDIRITTNNTAYKARNAAGTADLPLIAGDGVNKTTLFCNSARLRFADPSTAAAPGGSPVGALNVTIDGVGDVLIPYY